MKYLIRSISAILTVSALVTPMLAENIQEGTHLIVDSRMTKILTKSLDSVTTTEEARELLGEPDYIFKGSDYLIWEYRWNPFEKLDVKLAMNEEISSLGGFTLKFAGSDGKKVFWGWMYRQRRVEPITPEHQKLLERIRKNNDLIPKSERSEQGGSGQPATRPESKSEGSDKPQPEAEGRSR